MFPTTRLGQDSPPNRTGPLGEPSWRARRPNTPSLPAAGLRGRAGGGAAGRAGREPLVQVRPGPAPRQWPGTRGGGKQRLLAKCSRRRWPAPQRVCPVHGRALQVLWGDKEAFASDLERENGRPARAGPGDGHAAAPADAGRPSPQPQPRVGRPGPRRIPIADLRPPPATAAPGTKDEGASEGTLGALGALVPTTAAPSPAPHAAPWRWVPRLAPAWPPGPARLRHARCLLPIPPARPLRPRTGCSRKPGCRRGISPTSAWGRPPAA